MRSQPRNCTAIKALLLAALLSGGSAWAAPVAGTVTRLSGPLLVKKADGKMKILSLNAQVEQGDTLMSEKNTYVQIRFIDNSEMIVRPDTTFTIENFAFDPARPDGDNATFSLVKGSLRSTTGLLGKRNKERFSLKTPTGTVGIQGTTFIAHYVPPAPSAVGENLTREDLANRLLASGSQGKSPVARDNLSGAPGSVNQPVGKSPAGSAQPSAPPVLPPGLHLGVTDGAIIVTNNGGSLGFQAGQFGYVPSINQPPVIVPPNPGIQFVPPPSFSGSTPTGPSDANGNPGNANAVDCIVR
jgi:hypothetical protein